MKFTVTTLVWTYFGALLLLTGCDETSQQPRWYIPDSSAKAAATAGQGDIYGHYVCTDFIELVGARKSVKMVRTRPMFLEIVFKPEYGDSALLITAYENFFALWHKRSNDWIEIKNVLPNRDVLLLVHEGFKEISLTDTLKGREGGKQVHNWVFTKTANEYAAKGGAKPTMMYGWINKEIIAGSYQLPQNGEVTFNADGTITGWDLYDNYSICLGGKCFRLTDTPMDIITLNGSAGEHHYGLTINNDSVHFHTLMSDKPEEDYTWEPSGVAFSMARR